MQESLDKVLQEAVRMNDPCKVYTQMLQIYADSGKAEVWTVHCYCLMKSLDAEPKELQHYWFPIWHHPEPISSMFRLHSHTVLFSDVVSVPNDFFESDVFSKILCILSVFLIWVPCSACCNHDIITLTVLGVCTNDMPWSMQNYF